LIGRNTNHFFFLVWFNDIQKSVFPCLIHKQTISLFSGMVQKINQDILASEDAFMVDLLNNNQIYVMPIVNPDGAC
jgi:hypothetical protein